MIIKLTKSKIILQPMKVPEISNAIRVEYAYELGTNQLRPELYIDKQLVATKDNVVIDVNNILHGKDKVTLRVILRDVDNFIVKDYTETFAVGHYVVLGEKPIRPDIERYVKELESEIQRLKQEGEVI